MLINKTNPRSASVAGIFYAVRAIVYRLLNELQVVAFTNWSLRAPSAR
ncbi:hypothetical protein GA0116948_101502 [Chitinophaga costaii]|uniref:Uncharacterized protein n=1 Tax=Chitinophaga costaii TaxID=1335309 RepID=A0A1C3ZPT7_9BACT|nr:hypothetical protein GA0116948_101502 [Chitinophaga costaii]